MKTGNSPGKPARPTQVNQRPAVIDRMDYTCPEDGCTFKVKGLPPEARSVLADKHFKEKHS